MNKKQWMIPLSAFIAVGLAGCANDNRAATDRNDQNITRPIGYYSNENHQNSRYKYLADNDGPLTEMMDHNLGNEGKNANRQQRSQLQNRDKNGHPPNPTKPLANKDRNFFQRDNRFSTSDVNYHGHLNQRLGTTGTTTTPKFQDNISDDIRRRTAAVKNVENVRSVVYGNSVIIAVELIDNRRATETKTAIRNAVSPYVNGKSVQVITDDGTIGRDRNRNNDIQHRGK